MLLVQQWKRHKFTFGKIFIIVEPEIEDAYFVCVFGNGYTPPSQMNKWCVSRLKIDSGRQALRDLIPPVG